MTQATRHTLSCPAQANLGLPEHTISYWQWLPASGAPPKSILLCVHGLTRQGLDFAMLGEVLSARHDVLVIAPDVAGRGYSDWLPNPMLYHAGSYAADALHLIHTLQAAYSAPLPLAWLGTSMGGMIALGACAMQPSCCDRLILNDIGPDLQWQALNRIGEYLGTDPRFSTEEDALAYLQAISASFGVHSAEQWRALNAPCLRKDAQGEKPWRLHYDPAIGIAGKMVTQEMLPTMVSALWQQYDSLRIPTLLLRGAQSDLLTAECAQAMRERGPKAQLIEIANVGHAPTFSHTSAIEAVERFVFPG